MHSITWNPEHISTTWFDSHFNHAANRVLDWIGSELDLNEANAMLDFGCGGGISTLGVALRHPGIEIHGVDIGDKFQQLPELAEEQLHLAQLPNNLHFHKIPPLQVLADDFSVDAVFSWSVFEHVPQSQIPLIFADLYASLGDGGVFFLQIEPLYFSPWGSHLRRFIDTPWAHLLWSREQLREAVMDYCGNIPPQHQGHQYRERDMDSFKRFHLREFDSLNRITAGGIVNQVRDAGFEIIREQRLNMDLEVPEVLLEMYQKEDLLTNGILLLARKSSS
ncbi:MAG TPA: class I SAM-dependent methyltransferase [Chromatiaceae bacterium]|nr:class I SAM-dependent methyltransferase [Chromatiaceae bacterium]